MNREQTKQEILDADYDEDHEDIIMKTDIIPNNPEPFSKSFSIEDRDLYINLKKWI